MTAAPAPAAPAPAVPAARVSVAVRAGDLVAAEWIKLWSLRSAVWTLLIAAVAAAAEAADQAYGLTILTTAQRAQAPPLISPLLPGFEGEAIAALALGVLGVLTVSSEYGTGLIRTTLTAMPRRWAMLAAKAAVTGAVALAAGEVLAFGLYEQTQAILSGPHLGLALSHPGVLGEVTAEGLIPAAFALTGAGLGAVVRHTAGAVTGLFALVVVLPLVLSFLAPPWNHRTGQLTLAIAAYQASAPHPATGYLPPGPSLLVLLGWAALALAAGGVLLARRDA